MSELEPKPAENAYPNRYCPNDAHHLVALAEIFCVNCGSRLLPWEQCDTCKNYMGPSDKFCGGCGEPNTKYKG